MEKVTLELLADARKLAGALKAKVELLLLLPPDAFPSIKQELSFYIRDETIHLLEHPRLKNGGAEASLQALEALGRKIAPSLFLMAATADGRETAPRLAYRLGLGFLPHCLAFRIAHAKGGKALHATRVSHGGRVHQQSIWRLDRPLVITMKPGVAAAAEKQARPSELVLAEKNIKRHTVELPEASRVSVLEEIPPDPKTQDLTEAERIVSGGRGVGGSDGFRVVRDLAEALNASVGASRVAVDLGWIEYARQVGQTGRSVTPRLYIAVGISGASHHLLGMRSSEKIVAVNTDKEAPIFSVSHIGAACDLHELLPKLTARIRRHRREEHAAKRAAGPETHQA